MLRRPIDRGGSTRRFAARLPSFDGVLIFVGCVSFLGALLLIAQLSTIAAIVAICVAGLCAAVVSFGLVQTATGIIVLAMFFAPCNSIRPSPAASFVTMSDLLFALGFLLLAPVLMVRRISPPLIFVLGSFILIVMGILASLGSADPGTSLNHMTRFVLAGLGLPIAFMLWRPHNRIVVAFASAYVAGQALSVVNAIASGAEEDTGRYQGFSTHFNFFGLSALLAACLVPYIVAFIHPPWRWVAWAGGGLCLYGIWISGSRAALLVVVIIALLFPLVERSVPATGALAAAMGVGVLLSGRLLNDEGSNALGRLKGDSTTNFSDDERTRALTEAIKMFKAHPFLGTGFEKALEAHNIYLEIGVAVGVVGVVGYALILGSAIYPLFTVPHPYHRLAYPALAYAMIGMLTNALWDRFIWSVLALALIASFLPEDDAVGVDEGEEGPSTTKQRTRDQEQHV